MWFSILFTLYFFSTFGAPSSNKGNFSDDINIVDFVKDYVRPTTSINGSHIKYFATKEAIDFFFLKFILDELGRFTCLNFIKQENKFSGPGLMFDVALRNKVCVYKKQSIVIHLTRDCYESRSCIYYYMGLALGLIPHVNRYDRDKYVKIDFKNIDNKDKKYFNKVYRPHTKLNNIGFDFGSIMNRDVLYKSKNKKSTYSSKTLSKYYDKMLGQKYEFSFNDKKSLNSLYCNNKPSKVKCYNGGYYLLEKNKCICLRMYGGNNCETLLPTFCGTNSFKASSKQYKSLLLNKGDTCHFEISAKENEKVKIIVKKLTIAEATPCHPSVGLEIKYRKDKSVTGLTLCGNYKNISLPAFSNKVIIVFGGHLYDSFEISYKAVKN